VGTVKSVLPGKYVQAEEKDWNDVSFVKPQLELSKQIKADLKVVYIRRLFKVVQDEAGRHGHQVDEGGESV